jgi:plastocyanin
MKRTLLTTSLLGALVTLGTGCPEEKKEAAPAAPAAAPAAPAAPAAAPAAPAAPAAVAPGAAAPAAPGAAAPGAGGTGSIKGAVAFTGKAPELPKISRKADAYCGKTPEMVDESVVVNKNSTLKNVVVRVTNAPAPTGATPPTAAITQDNCSYTPRVQVILTGQPIGIRNGDQTLHNVHAYKGAATLFNQAQLAGSPVIEKKFADGGAVIKFKCDVHPWMLGWVVVNPNSFYAVTGDDGSFEIKDVPAGKYTVEAWHEKYGVKSAEVTVGGAPSDTKFAFDGTESAK